MWKVVVMAWLSGCNWLLGEPDGRDKLPEPPPDVQPIPKPPCVIPHPVCGTVEWAAACGNGVIDSCYSQLMPGHCTYVGGGIERCDSGHTPSCADLGLGAGQTTCVDCKTVDTSDCAAP